MMIDPRIVYLAFQIESKSRGEVLSLRQQINVLRQRMLSPLMASQQRIALKNFAACLAPGDVSSSV
jgi:hypothetical protein